VSHPMAQGFDRKMFSAVTTGRLESQALIPGSVDADGAEDGFHRSVPRGSTHGGKRSEDFGVLAKCRI
jgi:hypothetical protein